MVTSIHSSSFYLRASFYYSVSVTEADVRTFGDTLLSCICEDQQFSCVVSRRRLAPEKTTNWIALT
jgi:hypothetical protein